MGMGLLGIWAYFMIDTIPKDLLKQGLLGFAIFAFAFDYMRLKVSAMNSFVLKLMGPFMRKSEATEMSGLPFYALGVGLSLFFFEEKIAVLSILFLIFADPLSSYFGIRYGTDKILPNKSTQGTVAGFCICYLITLLYGLHYSEPSIGLLSFALFAGLCGALSELMSVFIDDNLTIPVISGAGLTLLNLFFQIF